METNLIQVVEASGMEKTKAQVILDQFTGFFEQAKEWEAKAHTIVVTDVTQVKEMKQARDGRLVLKGIRTNVENVRKALKEQSLREGKAIDGIANVIKALIVPIEEYLELQEKFALRIEAEKKSRIFMDRIVKISQYVSDPTSIYNIADMTDETFSALLESLEAKEAEKNALEQKMEEDHILKEKAESEERERIRQENIKLKAEAEKREKEIAEEKKIAEALLKAEQDKLIEARKVEREAREKVEAELKKKQEAEQERAAEEALALAAKDKAEHDALIAPDKDKLYALAERIKSVKLPINLSEEVRLIVAGIEKKLIKLSIEVKQQAELL